MCDHPSPQLGAGHHPISFLPPQLWLSWISYDWALTLRVLSVCFFLWVYHQSSFTLKHASVPGSFLLSNTGGMGFSILFHFGLAGNRISLCSPDWSGTLHSPASASGVLGLQAWATTPNSFSLTFKGKKKEKKKPSDSAKERL